MALVSVVVPVYNSEKYISECIKSILNQTYCDFELILVDDGSTDASGKICQKYEAEDSRIRYVYKKNGGVSSARNEGIGCANGKYIAFVDSDDIVKPQMLEMLLQQQADFAMCGYELYDDASKNVTQRFRCIDLCGSVKELAQNIRNYISPPFLLGPCFKLFQKSIITEKHVVFPPELSYGEDAIFVLEYLVYCKTVNISSYVGYSYRKHGSESLSNRFLINKIDINDRINMLIAVLLQQEHVNGEQILAERLLECFVSYEKELLASTLSGREKQRLFYEKYKHYEKQMGEPQRLAQRIIFLAGKCKLLYPLLYLFRIKG